MNLKLIGGIPQLILYPNLSLPEQAKTKAENATEAATIAKKAVAAARAEEAKLQAQGSATAEDATAVATRALLAVRQATAAEEVVTQESTAIATDIVAAAEAIKEIQAASARIQTAGAAATARAGNSSSSDSHLMY